MRTSKILSVLNAQYVKKYQIKILFSDRKERIVDFEGFLKRATHPEIMKYLKITEFKKFKLENGELMWGDFDLIFPIMDLYIGNIEKENNVIFSSAKSY